MFVQLICDSKRHPENNFQTYSKVLNSRFEYREILVKAFLRPSLYRETLGTLKFPGYPFETTVFKGRGVAKAIALFILAKKI